MSRNSEQEPIAPLPIRREALENLRFWDNLLTGKISDESLSHLPTQRITIPLRCSGLEPQEGHEFTIAAAYSSPTSRKPEITNRSFSFTVGEHDLPIPSGDGGIYAAVFTSETKGGAVAQRLRIDASFPGVEGESHIIVTRPGENNEPVKIIKPGVISDAIIAGYFQTIKQVLAINLPVAADKQQELTPQPKPRA